MTLASLNDHRDLVIRLAKAEELKTQLWGKAYPGGQNLDGMPHAPGVSDKVGFLAAEIADLESDIEDLKRQIDESKKNVAAYINAIDNPSTKLIFKLYFLHGMLWKEVADIVGQYHTEASVSSACYRYLQINAEEQERKLQDCSDSRRTAVNENND